MKPTANTYAALLRPDNPSDILGQEHLLAPRLPLHAALFEGKLHSMLLWGPPGCGKTTIALLLGKQPLWQTISLSAVDASVKDIKKIGETASQLRQQGGNMMLFIDEIHRFNKAQQDSLLHIVEQGIITLIGATTENPSFALNNALLSRMKVYVLHRMDDKSLKQLCLRALKWLKDNQQPKLQYDNDAIDLLIGCSDGDARRLLNTLQLACESADRITHKVITERIGASWRMFDKQGDQFYNLISALHKSVRGSDPDASLYWLTRMLEAGCDRLYIARRLIRIASEDIGNADPRALQISTDAAAAYERLGSPEGELALIQATLYLASTHKSNAVYVAAKEASKTVAANGSLEIPIHLCNAPTKLMQQLGYGKEYRYAHDYPDAFVAGETYLPEKLAGWQCYQPPNRGVEAHFAQRLASLRTINANRNSTSSEKSQTGNKTNKGVS